MIGCIVVGGLLAVGIAKIARHRARHGWYGGSHWHGGRFGGGCGGGGMGWHHRHHHGSHGMNEWGDDAGGGGWPGWEGAPDSRAWFGHRRGGGHPFGFKGFVLGGVLRRLETTPTQNQALRAAEQEFEVSLKAAKGEGRRTRADVAAALRRPAVDAESMGEMFARHDSAMDGVRKAFVGLMIKVHDVLDDTQRERLAQLMDQGPRWFRSPMAGMSSDGW